MLPCWTPWAVGGGLVEVDPGAVTLLLPGASNKQYADAQVSDYAGLPRRSFPWRPPVRLRVRACASGGGDSLRGTAGFGLWNDPFLPGRIGLPKLPRAAWFFFGSPPNNMPLAVGQAGHGWKAATFGPTISFWALLPLAPLGLLLMRVPALYRRFWPVGQRALGVAETALPGDLLAAPHEYTLEWRADRVTFAVDGETVLTTGRSPRGSLGFIAWIDNQYMIVTPQGCFGWGVLACGEQWLRLERITIEALTSATT
ncbi:MAG: hypothetical protein JW910_21640 [Anaerolineae bacterium]|nr:hypothetical protein [Anaerolineae bacterium]